MFHYATTDGRRLIICDRCGDMSPADFHSDEFRFMQAHRHQEES